MSAITLTSRLSPINHGAVAAVKDAVHNRRRQRVLVLLGGFSAEREVSLESGDAACRALETIGYVVQSFDVRRSNVSSILKKIEDMRPDAVFNALHGRYGEDGCVQGALNLLGTPYTHSGVLASALAMDKPAAKMAFATVGLMVAKHTISTRAELVATDHFGPVPCAVKPLNDGSSLRVTLIKDKNRLFEKLHCHSPEMAEEIVMVEEFICGRELTVAVMDQHALGVTEITTDHDFYDYEAKYAAGGSRHILPADLHDDLYAEAQRAAVRAHMILGCRGISRSDFRYDGERLVILETNTQPGMTTTSLLTEQAALAGVSFPKLCCWMVETAACDS